MDSLAESDSELRIVPRSMPAPDPLLSPAREQSGGDAPPLSEALRTGEPASQPSEAEAAGTGLALPTEEQLTA